MRCFQQTPSRVWPPGSRMWPPGCLQPHTSQFPRGSHTSKSSLYRKIQILSPPQKKHSSRKFLHPETTGTDPIRLVRTGSIAYTGTPCPLHHQVWKRTIFHPPEVRGGHTLQMCPCTRARPDMESSTSTTHQ